MLKNHIPMRTCIVCRGKFEQKSLYRLQCKEKKIVAFLSQGRSFYICKECVRKIDEAPHQGLKKLEKKFFHLCKNRDDYIKQLKESLEYVRQS